MTRPKLYIPRSHRHRAPLAAALKDLAYDARHAPVEFWGAMVVLALFAGIFIVSCARRHSLVAPADRTGLRTYEAPR